MADTKVTGLVQLTDPDIADVIPIVDDPAGTPSLKKITIADLWKMQAIADPGAQAAGFLRIYAKDIGGRIVPKWVGPAGLDTVMQPAFFGNNIVLWTPTTSTGGTWQGTVGASAGTFTRQLPTTTNQYTAVARARYANVITTANQALGVRSSELMFFRGSTGGQGGFFFACRFGFDVWTAGGRLFVGLSVTATPTTAQPSAATNMCGFGIDAADTAITFMSNDGTGTATKTAIAGQPALASNQGYDAIIFNPPNSSTIYYRLVNVNTGAQIVNSSVTTDLPAAGTMMMLHCEASNAALTAATAIHLGVARIYCETDY